MTKVDIDPAIAKLIKDGEVQGIGDEDITEAEALYNEFDKLCEGKSLDLVLKVATNLVATCLFAGSGHSREDFEGATARFALHLKQCVEAREAEPGKVKLA
jgi:hypothetical protein